MKKIPRATTNFPNSITPVTGYSIKIFSNYLKAFSKAYYNIVHMKRGSLDLFYSNYSTKDTGAAPN